MNWELYIRRIIERKYTDNLLFYTGIQHFPFIDIMGYFFVGSLTSPRRELEFYIGRIMVRKCIDSLLSYPRIEYFPFVDIFGYFLRVVSPRPTVTLSFI